MNRDLVTGIAELVGLVLIVTGVALIYPPAAFIVAGVGLLLLSVAYSGGKDGDS